MYFEIQIFWAESVKIRQSLAVVTKDSKQGTPKSRSKTTANSLVLIAPKLNTHTHTVQRGLVCFKGVAFQLVQHSGRRMFVNKKKSLGFGVSTLVLKH